ncbi:MAG TPA: FAD-dependent oxidoreductase, partial [Humibacillus xanthopallidus]|nr:FAD-dependent oxidoreductase [Humibacillus xanthopallidus]
MDTDATEAGQDATSRGSDDDEGIFATVAVIGAGAMGSGIAQVAATAGHRVVLVDPVIGAAAEARQRIEAALDRLASKGRISREHADATLERLVASESVHELPECGLVIEAVPEDLHLKRRLFADLSERQPANTVLATNTS